MRGLFAYLLGMVMVAGLYVRQPDHIVSITVVLLFAVVAPAIVGRNQ